MSENMHPVVFHKMCHRNLVRWLVLLAAILNGCAMAFHAGPRDVPVNGPADMKAETVDGRPLGMSTYYGQYSIHIHMERGIRDDSIVLVWNDHRQRQALAKIMSPWMALDLWDYGLVTILDDLTGSWFDYRPVNVTIDSSDPNGFRTDSRTWLNEPAGRKRVELLVLGGVGTGLQAHSDPGVPAPYLFPTSPSFDGAFFAEFGAGIDYDKRVEAFFLTRSQPAPLVPYSYNYYGYSYSYYHSTITPTGGAVRFFHDNFFLQIGVTRASLTSDSSSYDSVNFYRSYHYSTPLTFLDLGLGWSGDLSYVALNYSSELKPFYLGRRGPFTARQIYLTWGTNLRF